jgi:predicted PurR-regulated permease PerM
MTDLRTNTGASSLRGRRTVVPSEIPGIRELLALQVAVVVIAALYLGSGMLIPVVLAVLLSFVLQPLAGLLRSWHLGRFPSVLLSVLLALGLLAGVLWLIGTQLMALTHQLGADQQTIQRKVAGLRRMGSGPSAFSGFGPLRARIGQLLADPSVQAAAGRPVSSGPPAPLPVRQVDAPASPISIAEQVLDRLAHPLGTALVVFVVAIFILLQHEDLRDRMIRLFGTSDLHRTTLALDDAGSRLSRYFITQLAINSVFGALIAGGLFLIGVPGALLWGILAGLMRYIPYLGILLAAIPPVLLAAATFDGWGHAAAVFGLIVVIDQTLGQFLEPMIVGQSTGLSPISVVLAATFWTFLWGAPGLILSTPLTLCAVVLGRHVERLRFLEVMLGDSPPLSPVESLYQRLLAGDPDEIEDQAVLLLKTMPLAEYYDEVLAGALRLAAYDAHRDVLDEERLQAMAMALDTLLDGLEEEAERPDTDAAPGATAGGGSVVCIAGGFALDRIAARMAVQVLQRCGIAARLVTQDAISRSQIGSFDPGDATLVCLCAVSVETRTMALRYALRRLAGRAPRLPVAMLFWPDDADTARRAAEAINVAHPLAGVRELAELAGAEPLLVAA